MVAVLALLYLRKGDSGPDEEDLLGLSVIDEHGTIQEGPLIGNCQRMEDELLFENPKWVDDEGNKYQGSVDITQKIPIPFRDGTGRTKRLWIGRDMGQIDVVSASTIMSEKIPKRWDLPLIDPRRIFRHLEGPKTGQSITNALTSRTGIITMIGLILFGGFMFISILTASGHIR